MKRIIFLPLIFVFTIPFFSNAQDSAKKQRLRLGLRGGVFLSTFTIDDLPSGFDKPKGDAAVYGGLQIDIPVSKKVSIVPEVLFAISHVSSYTPGGLAGDDLSHLLIPVQFKYKAGKFGLFAGPQAEILLKAEGNTGPSFYNGDIKDSSYRKFGLSGVLGAEYVFKYRFGIDARFQFSTGDMRDDNSKTYLTSYGKISMKAFQIGLFYRFGKRN